ncbi:hypothetical protein R1flu_015802 [Riccia fluitans]|uniref:GCF C-terminal domain-containing protein n=1 Tax=Riccia fluitans TaxID=41844 RepID=A0ABD1YKG2_9MARC
MQELKDYISVLCDFLQHKAPAIEEHMQRLHEERSNAVTERRAGDNADELAEVEVAVGAAKAVLTKGGGTANATAAAVAAAAAHAAKEGSNIAPQLDEFGRDVNLQKRLEKEFAQQTKVKEKLEGWKSQFASAYRDAYVSLSAPAIFAPYVRLELLEWDPLYSDAGFSNMLWYRQLYEYGMPPNGQELDPNDKDADLVPKLVEKVAFPVLHHEIVHCWDRLSSQGTRNAVAAVTDILIYVPATSDSLQELLEAFRSRMAEAVAAIEVPTWSLHLALDGLLSSKILPHLRTLLVTPHDAVTRTERVVAALSPVWVGSNREISPKLSSFVEHVISLTRVVEKKRDAGACPEDTVGLARRMKKMLVELNEYDRAYQLAKHFQLREAL